MTKLDSNFQEEKWSYMTWVISLAVLITGSLISYYLKNFADSLLLYLPTSLAIVLMHWFGWRILPLTYINSLVTLLLWSAPGGWDRILLLATREPVIVFASGFLCKDLVKQSNGLSDTKSLIRFILLGIIIPDLINSIYTYQYTFINKDLEKVALLWLSDFITIFSIAIPLLHFFKPVPYQSFFRLSRFPNLNLNIHSKIGLKELLVTAIIFVGLNFLIDFDQYWFIYGIVASLIAVRNGFDTVIIANAVIFILNYILPLLDFGDFIPASKASTQKLSVHLGMGTMFLVSSLIGRAITDLLNKEAELTEQKREVEETNEKLLRANREMDRFVYSVSHDISAPLKSIKGLINLSRLEKSNAGDGDYLNKIEQSALKLEDFVGEVLDHSRTNRKEIQMEVVNLNQLVMEITENLRYVENFNTIQFKLELHETPDIYTDKFLLKVVLSNLLSNAIKYQKTFDGHLPEIKIHSKISGDYLDITIFDNGEGIREIYKDKIFDMFYRGTSNSSGSGLGLYIAREAVEKLKGKISAESTYGVGSAFKVSIPIQEPVAID